MSIFMKRVAFFAMAISASLISVSARADSPVGVWERDIGTSRVRVAQCGDSYCGVIVWVRDRNSPTKVGMRVFYDMRQVGPSAWDGMGFNPLDGQTYRGSMTVTGDAMATSGCLIGRLICESFYWKRVK